jgi:hypothetical protein
MTTVRTRSKHGFAVSQTESGWEPRKTEARDSVRCVAFVSHDVQNSIGQRIRPEDGIEAIKIAPQEKFLRKKTRFLGCKPIDDQDVSQYTEILSLMLSQIFGQGRKMCGHDVCLGWELDRRPMVESKTGGFATFHLLTPISFVRGRPHQNTRWIRSHLSLCPSLTSPLARLSPLLQQDFRGAPVHGDWTLYPFVTCS